MMVKFDRLHDSDLSRVGSWDLGFEVGGLGSRVQFFRVQDLGVFVPRSLCVSAEDGAFRV